MNRAFAVTVVTFTLVVVSTVLAQAPVKSLRYQFQPGETYTYAVKIVADRPSEVETYEGHIKLTVKFAGADGTRLTSSALLPGKVKVKVAGAPAVGKKTKSAPGSRNLPITITPPKGAPTARETTVDVYGNIVKSTGDIGLSYLLGSTTRLVIEPTSRGAEKAWQRSNDVTLREIESFGPFGKGPSNVTTSAAKEVVNYEIVNATDNLVRVKKTSEFKTAAGGATGPRVKMNGSGEFVFDTKKGLIQSCEYQATLSINEGNISVDVPLTISYRLMDAVEAATTQKLVDERKKNPFVKQRSDLEEITDDKLTATLAEIKAGGVKGNLAVSRLAKSAPLETRRDEVAAILDDVAKSQDATARAYAANALVVWGTPKNVPTLIELIKDTNASAKQHAVEALGRFQDAKGAEAVAQLLPDGNVGLRLRAVASLKTMGPSAEKAVQPYLKHATATVRKDACKILSEIGTQQSLAALKVAMADRDRTVATDAAAAVQAIQKRK